MLARACRLAVFLSGARCGRVCVACKAVWRSLVMNWVWQNSTYGYKQSGGVSSGTRCGRILCERASSLAVSLQDIMCVLSCPGCFPVILGGGAVLCACEQFVGPDNRCLNQHKGFPLGGMQIYPHPGKTGRAHRSPRWRMFAPHILEVSMKCRFCNVLNQVLPFFTVGCRITRQSAPSASLSSAQNQRALPITTRSASVARAVFAASSTSS